MGTVSAPGAAPSRFLRAAWGLQVSERSNLRLELVGMRVGQEGMLSLRETTVVFATSGS